MAVAANHVRSLSLPLPEDQKVSWAPQVARQLAGNAWSALPVPKADALVILTGTDSGVARCARVKALPLIAVVMVAGTAVGVRAETVNSESARASLHVQCKREAGKKFTDMQKRSDYVKRCIAAAASVRRGPRFVEPQ